MYKMAADYLHQQGPNAKTIGKIKEIEILTDNIQKTLREILKIVFCQKFDIFLRNLDGLDIMDNMW